MRNIFAVIFIIIAVLFHCALLPGHIFLLREGILMGYKILTPHGFFEVLQQLSYGDMIIAGILVIILVVVGFKVVYDIADREGFI